MFINFEIMFIIVKKEVRKMYDNIIFDFNGTLIDDCELCLKILNYLTKEYNLGKVSMEKYKDIFTFPVYLYYKDLGFDTSTESFKVIASKFHSYYNELSYDEVKLFDDVIKNAKSVSSEKMRYYELLQKI